ncbi:MAG: hypothetical protein QM398_02820 [Thermoproteota archaeon]|nr:hypothetical protein [Thermoproteota archaeon]NLD67111.1 hypothetical protein [Thermoproteota archaeon]
MSSKRVFVLNLKDLFASKGRQKIIEVLSLHREMNMMQLVSRVGGRYPEVNRNLAILEDEGIIISEYRKQVKRAKVRIIKIIKENPRTQKLLRTLKELQEDQGPSIALGAHYTTQSTENF